MMFSFFRDPKGAELISKNNVLAIFGELFPNRVSYILYKECVYVLIQFSALVISMFVPVQVFLFHI